MIEGDRIESDIPDPSVMDFIIDHRMRNCTGSKIIQSDSSFSTFPDNCAVSQLVM